MMGCCQRDPETGSFPSSVFVLHLQIVSAFVVLKIAIEFFIVGHCHKSQLLRFPF